VGGGQSGLTDGICNLENPNLRVTRDELLSLRVDDNGQNMEEDCNLEAKHDE